MLHPSVTNDWRLKPTLAFIGMVMSAYACDAQQPPMVAIQGQPAPAVGFQARLPMKGISKNTGLYIELTDDGMGEGQFGYRQLVFTITSPTPVTADTQITVRCHGCEWYRSSNSLSGEVDGELLIGQTQTKLTIRLPQTTEWNQVWWDIWIDGVHDELISCDREQPLYINQGGNSRWQTGRMLLLEAGKPANQATAASRGVQMNSPGLSMLFTQGPLADNWLDYTPYDYVSVNFDKLKQTAESNPEKIAVLMDWVRAGGVLWIEQVGDDWSRLQTIHPLCGWEEDQSVEPAEPENRRQPGLGGWTYVDLRPPAGVVSEPDLMEDFDPELRTMPRAVDQPPIYTKDWFVVRRCGWGTVVAFQGAYNKPPRSISTKNQMMAGAFWNAQTWPRRHGLTPGAANGDFSNWLIPGVGLAPVVSFQVLITLFVLVIGPVNYWLLKRARRLHLIVVTVPVAALLITGALLAYGLLSDGVATRLRAQSITLLDQTTNQAATWSRLSYYAAFAPRNGLTFSDQTAVYPIYPGLVESYAGGGYRTAREIEWTDGEQRLTKGWLASRTPTQLLAIEPRTTQAGLTMTIDESQSRVENRFESPAQLICVVDPQGEWLMAEEIAAGETGELARVERTDAVAAVRKLLAGREPQFPGAIDAASESPLLSEQRRSMRRRNRNRNRNYSYVSFSQSELQDQWQQLLGFSGGKALNLPAGSYVMIAEQAPLPLSKDTFAVEDSSVHIVIGKW